MGVGPVSFFLCSQIEGENKFLPAFFALCFVTISSTCVVHSRSFMLWFNFILGLQCKLVKFVLYFLVC